MPRFDELERSNRDLWQRVLDIEAAIGRLAGQHSATWGQVQDIDARAAAERELTAALRDETADILRSWLRLRTDLARLAPSDERPS